MAAIDRKRLRSQRLREVNFQGAALRLGMNWTEEDLPQLFDRFYRVNKDRSRATGGSGLGLAISKQIVDMHGGTVAVRSRVGSGSTFDVRLPKSPVPRSASYAL